MQRVRVSYSDIIFLYGYLRLIDLSLDRSRWVAWQELQSYFISKIIPSDVLRYLKNRYDISDQELDLTFFNPDTIGVFKRIKALAFKDFTLNIADIVYCCQLIKAFQEALSSKQVNYTLEVENIRMNIVEFYSNVLGKMISRKERKRLDSIEHFLQYSDQAILLDKIVPEIYLSVFNREESNKRIQKYDLGNELVRVRHHTSNENLQAIKRMKRILCSDFRICIEVYPFIDSKDLKLGQSGAEGYVEFLIPRKMISKLPCYISKCGHGSLVGNGGFVLIDSISFDLCGLSARYITY